MSALFVKYIVFIISPSSDLYKVWDKTRNDAFHQGIIANNDILIAGLRAELLMYN